jgi:hypothetical protein
MAELSGPLLLDAQTFLTSGGSGGKPRPTSTIFFKTTAAGVLSLPVPRDLDLVYVNANNAGIVSRVSDSYTNQTTAAGFNNNIVAYFTASIFAICNAPFKNGEILYVCNSTGLQGTLVFAENSTQIV